MATVNATRPTLAEALRATQGANGGPGTDPLIDRLATALTLVPQADPTEFHTTAAEALDLPMLVLPGRALAVPPPAEATPPARIKEGKAALIGFGAGLVLLVPLGLAYTWHAAQTAPEQASPPTLVAASSAAAPTQLIRTTPRATLPVAPAAAPAIEPPPVTAAVVAAAVPVATAAASPPAVVEPVPKAKPDFLATAAGHIARGDIVAARDAIVAADLDANPLALFAFAETYDPNMLAAWNVRGADADADRARVLYRRALDSGVMKARQRLEALD